jgi:predicted nucleic acid-binding protein
MLLVDSSVWIDYFNGQANPETDYLDRALEEQIILVGDLILAEVLQGFRRDEDFEQAHLTLARFTQVNLVSPALAVRSAQNYRSLRALGVTVRKTIDCLIATYCLEHDLDLLHKDADYDGFEQHLGLRVVHA